MGGKEEAGHAEMARRDATEMVSSTGHEKKRYPYSRIPVFLALFVSFALVLV